MTRLIFWYGTPQDDLTTGFSFLPENKIVSYEEGCKKELDQLPSRIVNKLNKKSKLAASDAHLIEGLKQIKAEIEKPPEKRLEWLFELDEDYDDYLDQIHDDTSDEGDEDEQFEEIRNTAVQKKKSPSSNRKKKKQKTDKEQKKASKNLKKVTKEQHKKKTEEDDNEDKKKKRKRKTEEDKPEKETKK